MLKIEDLRIEFAQGEAIHGIDLEMKAGERLGLVGESGSGKTVTALTVAGLIGRAKAQISGSVVFEGTDLLKCSRDTLRGLQGREIGMVFQEPMTSLDPTMRVGRQIEESLRIHTKLSSAERKALALETMASVELPEPEICYKKYPHQLSGGQRQRAMIAAAIITRPKLLIADEPTTALDVTVQAQILKLLRRINDESGMGILFISHDLNVVRQLCTRVVVMQNGYVVEEGPTEQVYSSPREEYTKKLIAAIPRIEKRQGRESHDTAYSGG